MTVARKLQSLGFLVALLAMLGLIYPLSLQVATTRSEVYQVEQQLRQTRENIRYLEAELGARASMRQLERWNAEFFGYAAPTSAQYLAGERELASLEGRVPQGSLPVVAPVLTAVAAATPREEGPSADAAAAPEGLALAARVEAPRPREAEMVVASRSAVAALVPAAQAAAPAPRAAPQGAPPSASLKQSTAERRAARSRMLEEQLLSPATLADIERAAARERRRDGPQPAAKTSVTPAAKNPSGSPATAAPKPKAATPAKPSAPKVAAQRRPEPAKAAARGTPKAATP